MTIFKFIVLFCNLPFHSHVGANVLFQSFIHLTIVFYIFSIQKIAFGLETKNCERRKFPFVLSKIEPRTKRHAQTLFLHFKKLKIASIFQNFGPQTFWDENSNIA